MTTKHTPGPWTIFIERDEKPPQIAVVAGEDDNHLDWICDCGAKESKEARANAALIAAAPELMEALERIVNNGYIDNAPTSILSEACAAIAKAKGE